MTSQSTFVRLFLLLLVCCGMMTAAIAQEDTGLTFNILESDETFVNAFEDEINAHLYAFFGTTGDVVNITMQESPDSTLDPYLVLLGASGAVYAADDDGGATPAAPFASRIQDFELPEDGVYMVLATSFTGLRRPAFVMEGEDPSPQFYEITVTGNTTPQDLDTEEFTIFYGDMSINQTSTLEITAQEPVFYIVFPAEAGESLTVFTGDDGNGESVDTVLHLFDSEGNRIGMNDDAEGRGLFSEITFDAPSEGPYLILATAYDFNDSFRPEWSGAGTFTLTIER